MRCEASGHNPQKITGTLADAGELLHSAPRGSIPWAQGLYVQIEGTMFAGRMEDFRATIGLLHEVDPAPEAVGRMALVYLATTCILDALGSVAEGTAVAERFSRVLGSTDDRASLARFWWHILISMRGTYAYDDPWDAFVHSDAIQPIYDVIGGERVFLNMQLFRGMNLWYLGALAPAERYLEAIPAADESLGVASSLRRFHLAWLLADRGALDEARALASQLAEHGHAHHFPLEEGRGRWVLAEALRRIGDLDAAERELEIALRMAMPLERPGVLGTQAALHLAQGRAEEALAAAEEAVSRCADMGGCGMFRGAFVRLAHAEALHATGAHDAARTAIADARTRLFVIAGRLPDPDYRKSFLEDVPENARTLLLARTWLDH
jgi:tetratricopeptide (TPR) repeat protein